MTFNMAAKVTAGVIARLVLIAIAGSLIAIAGSIVGCDRATPEEVETETVVPVSTETARVGDIRSVVHATGLVEPAPGADLVVIAPEAARIAAIPKADGDTVRRGEVLVRFDIPSLAADAASKRAEVDRAEARLRNAKAAQTRAHDLFDRGVAARKEMEDADRELLDAQAALPEAKAALDAATMLTERAIVRATFDGIIAKRAHNPGDFVEATASDPVLRVIDPRRLEVHASIPLAEIARIAIGATARVLVAPDSEPEPARVVSRPAAVDTGTASAPVRLQFTRAAKASSSTRLPAGTPVQVEIDGEAHTGVVLVPASAIVREGSDTAVFVVAGNKAHRRPIVTGLADAAHVEVRSGLKAGEVVITRGQAGLPDGAPISAAAAEKSAEPEQP